MAEEAQLYIPISVTRHEISGNPAGNLRILNF